MTIRPVYPRVQSTAGLAVYTCDGCGARFNWQPGKSVWHGSWRDMDDGRWERIRVYCGDCEITAETVGAA